MLILNSVSQRHILFNLNYQQLIIAKRRTLTVDVLYRQLTR